MPKSFWIYVALMAPMLLPVTTWAAGIPDPVEGKKFAQMECAKCHVVEERLGKVPPPKSPGAPPHFKTIAFDPEMTVDKIRESMKLPHGEMANLLIAEKDIDNIISYIVSMRR